MRLTRHPMLRFSPKRNPMRVCPNCGGKGTVKPYATVYNADATGAVDTCECRKCHFRVTNFRSTTTKERAEQLARQRAEAERKAAEARAAAAEMERERAEYEQEAARIKAERNRLGLAVGGNGDAGEVRR